MAYINHSKIANSCILKSFRCIKNKCSTEGLHSVYYYSQHKQTEESISSHSIGKDPQVPPPSGP